MGRDIGMSEDIKEQVVSSQYIDPLHFSWDHSIP